MMKAGWKVECGAAWLATALLAAGVFGSVLLAWPVPPADPLDFFQPKTAMVIFASFLAGAVYVVHERERWLDAENGALLLFLGLGVTSVLTVATNRSLAWSSLGTSASGVLFFLVARGLSSRARGVLLTTVVSTLLLAALIATLEANGLTPRLSAPHRVPGGPLGNRNALSHLLVLGLPATACLAMGEHRRWRGLALASAFASGFVVVIARSRGAWLGATWVVVLTSVLVLFVATRTGNGSICRRGAAVLLVWVLGGTSALLLPNQLRWNSPHPYRDTLRGLVEADSGSGLGRLIQYETSLRMARAYGPLGVGPGNWPVEYPRFAAANDPSVHQKSYEPTNRYPSSDWIAVLSERGLFAFTLLVLVALRLFVLAGSTLLRAPRTDEALAGGAAAVLLVVTTWLGAIDAVLITPAASCVTAVLLGTLLPRRPADTGGPPAQGRTLAGAVRWGGGGLLLAFGLLGTSREVALLVIRHAAGTDSNLDAIEAQALRFAADDYPTRMTLGIRWGIARQCDRAEPHLAAASRLLPSASAPGEIASRCRSREKRLSGGARTVKPVGPGG
ncbi:O-antigen ligase family protein [Corallococcus sp. M7]